MQITATHRLADHLLDDGGLEKYVTDKRASGVSWRRIAIELRDDTGLDVTHETLRTWFPHLVKTDAA